MGKWLDDKVHELFPRVVKPSNKEVEGIEGPQKYHEYIIHNSDVKVNEVKC